MSRPDPLAVSLVEAAFELHRRRLWLEVPGDAPFLIRVPGEEYPLVASIMGHEGSDYGLLIARGEDGFAQIERCILDGQDREEDFEAQTLLNVSVVPLGVIPPDVRGVLTSAGFQARRESLAPCVFSKLPHSSPRNPSRSEMRLMLAAVRGVCAAHDAGEFRPTSLERRRKRVFQITIEGEGRELKAHTAVVPWPTSNTPREVEMFPELRAVDRNLPRLDATWLMAFMLVPGGRLDNGRNLAACIVAEIPAHQVISAEIVPSGETHAVATQLAALFAAGLPREIIFANADLHEALSIDLASLDIRTTLDPDHDDLAEIVQSFADKLETLVDDAAEVLGGTSAPESLEEWRVIDQALTDNLVKTATGKRTPGPRALAHYFGSKEVGQEVFEELEHLEPASSFIEWVITDYRLTKNATTILEKRLKASSTTPVQRKVIEARIGSRLSIYRVDAAEPGATLDVEDIFDGTRFTIHDRALSGCGVEGLFLPMRISKLGEWNVAAFAGPPLTQFQIRPALHLLEELGVELSSDGLRKSAHFLGRLWELVLDHQEIGPALTNTDGDPIMWHTATFRVADGKALSRALGDRHDIECDEFGVEWTWTRPGGVAPGVGQNTVLGSLQMIGDQLVLEVNSANRLARAREWIDTLPGVSFERATAREILSDDEPADDQLPESPEKVDPELVRAVEQMHRKYMSEWLDMSIPALGDLSPREACKTPEGRRQVERLVRTMPPTMSSGGLLQPPRDELLRELGIGR